MMMSIPEVIRRSRALRRYGVIAAVGLALAVPGPAVAQAAVASQPGAAAQAEAERAISRLRSPYCPGLMLEVCPSPEAGALRDSIRALAAEGHTAAELEEWMIARHGEEWRGVPQGRGRGLVAWVIPPLVLLAAAGFLFTRLRRDRTEAAAMKPPSAGVSDADRERLAAAMREHSELEGLDP